MPTVCIFDPDKGHVLDVLKPNGRGHYGGRTLAELTAQAPRAYLADEGHCLRMSELRHITPVERITEERAGYLLEVLFPRGWHRAPDCESWFMSEFDSGRVTCHVVRLGDEWFAFSDIVRPHDARVRHVLIGLAQAAAVEAPARVEG